ncbi:MAG TPA: hypothetical protein VJ258_04905 [Candidatus Limnocylindrales bacterium]|nr:hypothetical protein [Candidatus Limnocylindrales bacterium]
MLDHSQTVRGIATAETITDAESISTFEWRGLHLHIVTRAPLSAEQVLTIERILKKAGSVGLFASVLGMMLGRSVRIRTERPSPDIRLEVGR